MVDIKLLNQDSPRFPLLAENATDSVLEPVTVSWSAAMVRARRWAAVITMRPPVGSGGV
jgi:hypothetical protein